MLFYQKKSQYEKINMIDGLLTHYTNFKTNIVNSINVCIKEFLVPRIFLKQVKKEPEIAQRNSRMQPAAIFRKNQKKHF
jgi:hypothetical protein